MLRVLTANTSEAFELNVALAEILEQLDMENNCLKNSAGFLFCHPDFIDTGVAQNIAESLPFEIVGATTVCNLTEGLRDIAGLTISVLTSDTVEFSAASLPGCSTEEEITKVYEAATAGKSGIPSLIFPFATTAGGDIAVSVVDKLTGGQIPLFGTNATDNTADASLSVTLHNGKIFQKGLTILMAWGELNARFFVSEISDDFIQKQHAIITKSEGHIVMSINDITPADYLDSIGINLEQSAGVLHAIPFFIDFCDGTKPVGRVFYRLTPEGYIVTGGIIPENSTMAVGALDSEDIESLTDKLLEDILSSGKSMGMLLFPCSSHFWAMGTMPFDLIQNKLDKKIPYQVFYSGGEICPVYDSDGKIHNRFHSFTCVACSFE